MHIEIDHVEDEGKPRQVLQLCYRILGERLRQDEQYTYEAWRGRLEGGGRLMLYAHDGDRIVSAVLARRENSRSLVCGMVACEENYRGRGITKRLMLAMEKEAESMGFEYITLGSDADGFYESCGYQVINTLNGQKIFQKRF